MTFYNAIPGYTLLGYGAASRSGSVCPDNPTVGPGIDVGGGACQYAQPGGANATITCNPGTALNRDATSCEKGSGGFSLYGKWMGVPIWGWALGGLALIGLMWMMSRPKKLAANRRHRRRRLQRGRRREAKRDERAYSRMTEFRVTRTKAGRRRRRMKKNAKQSTMNRMLAAYQRRSEHLSDDDWVKGRHALERALGPGRVSRKTRRMNKARRAMRSVLVGHRYRANVSRKCDCGGGGDWKEGHAADCPRGIYNRSAAGKKAARGRKKVATLKKRADQLRRKYGTRARSGTRVKRP